MRKNKASGDPSISDGSIEDAEELSEEPTEEHSLSAPSSDNESDCTGQYNEELDEEAAHELSDEYAPQPSSDNDDDSGDEYSIEEPSEEQSTSDPSSDGENNYIGRSSNELNEEPNHQPLQQYAFQPSSKIEFVPKSSNKMKRPSDASEDDSGSCQAYNLAKNCKPEQSLGPESDFGSAAEDIHNKSLMSKQCLVDGKAAEEREQGGCSGKRRRSRWDTQPKTDAVIGEGDTTIAKRKTRWSSDDSQLKLPDPIKLPDYIKHAELSVLKEKLAKIDADINADLHYDWAKGEKSPSPPVYDAFGIRINKRAARLSEMLRERQAIVSRLNEEEPTWKNAPDKLPPKLCKKLYIPVKEYPNYNFVGLIIGPQGNTLKKMEKETGANIKLRGRGACLKRGGQKPDPYDSEDLHVLIEADYQESLDEAVAIVEKLLIPVADGMNEHKRSQLEQLAALRGTLLCKICKERGHFSYCCPQKNSSYNSPPSCNTCFSSSHSTADCPLTVSTHVSNLTNHQGSFLVGGSGGLAPVSSSVSWGSSSNSSYSHPGLGSTPTMDCKPNKEVDYANLFVLHLPQTVGENRLRELFSSFGNIINAIVIKDRSTGLSKGYGFVKYDNPHNAAKAVAHMNGYRIGGKSLKVQVKGLSATVSSNMTLLPRFPGTTALSKDISSQEAWPGPPGSLLPESGSASTKSMGLGLLPSHTFLGLGDLRQEPLLSSHPLQSDTPVSSHSLEEFPGHPNYPISQYSSYSTAAATPKNLYQQPLLSHPLDSNLTSVHPPEGGTRIAESGYRNFMPGRNFL